MLGTIVSYTPEAAIVAVITPPKESGLPELPVTERHQILMNEEQIKPGQEVIFQLSHDESGPLAIQVKHGSYANSP